MRSEIQKLHDVWKSNRTFDTTPHHQLSFDDLTNSIVSTGPFSFYVIDFFDMSLSHISPTLCNQHGFGSETMNFNSILTAIHPEDIEFVIKAEAFLTKFLLRRFCVRNY